jgi:hypothetical protein
LAKVFTGWDPLHGVCPFVVCYLIMAALCELGAKVTSLSYPLVQHVLFSCTIGPKDGPHPCISPLRFKVWLSRARNGGEIDLGKIDSYGPTPQTSFVSIKHIANPATPSTLLYIFVLNNTHTHTFVLRNYIGPRNLPHLINHTLSKRASYIRNALGT